jgi:hypothetical protein
VTQGADPRNPEVRTRGSVYGKLDLSNGSESSHIMLCTKIRIQSTKQNVIVGLLMIKKSIPSNKSGNVNTVFTSRSDHATIVGVEKQ